MAQKCFSCNGKGWKRCPKCHGTGKYHGKECDVCYDSGSLLLLFIDSGSKGKIECERCGGTGEFTR